MYCVVHRNAFMQTHVLLYREIYMCFCFIWKFILFQMKGCKVDNIVRLLCICLMYEDRIYVGFINVCFETGGIQPFYVIIAVCVCII